METPTLVASCLGVCSLLLLTVTIGLAQNSNIIQPATSQTSTVKHSERHHLDQAQSYTFPADHSTFYLPKGDEIKSTLSTARFRKGGQVVSGPLKTSCSEELPWCWSRAFSAAYSSFGPDAIKRCTWCRARR